MNQYEVTVVNSAAAPQESPYWIGGYRAKDARDAMEAALQDFSPLRPCKGTVCVLNTATLQAEYFTRGWF